MLKGKQKQLDKNKDGKISSEDFKMMKAKYGKMMKAGKGGGADIDYKLGTKMQGDYEGKTLTGKAKEFLGTAAKQTKGSIGLLRQKVLKKLVNSQVSEKEAQEIIKSLPKAKHGKMIKASLGTMAQDLVRKVFGKNKAVAKTGSNMGAMSFKGKKLPIETLVQKATEQNKAKSGKMMKAKYGKMTKANMGMEAESTQGYGAARTSGMGLQDENLIPGKSLDYYKDLI